MPLTVLDTPLAGLKLIERQQLGDSRGFLERLFCAEELAAAGWRKSVVQINHTLTQKAGTVRGMHFQRPPHAEVKLVTCLRGTIWDVAVDLRAGSATFLQWHAEELSSANHRALLIPEGFSGPWLSGPFRPTVSFSICTRRPTSQRQKLGSTRKTPCYRSLGSGRPKCLPEMDSTP